MIAVMILSILSPIEDVMRTILTFFHDSVGFTWAWSIVALTILVRIALVPLTVRQIHSMTGLEARVVAGRVELLYADEHDLEALAEALDRLP